jgi:hypothetical protein
MNAVHEHRAHNTVHVRSRLLFDDTAKRPAGPRGEARRGEHRLSARALAIDVARAGSGAGCATCATLRSSGGALRIGAQP